MLIANLKREKCFVFKIAKASLYALFLLFIAFGSKDSTAEPKSGEVFGLCALHLINAVGSYEGAEKALYGIDNIREIIPFEGEGKGEAVISGGYLEFRGEAYGSQAKDGKRPECIVRFVMNDTSGVIGGCQRYNVLRVEDSCKND